MPDLVIIAIILNGNMIQTIVFDNAITVPN